MLALFLLLVITTVMVDSFTFPGDWHKIRQMMEARKEKESEVVYYLVYIIFINLNLGSYSNLRFYIIRFYS